MQNNEELYKNSMEEFNNLFKQNLYVEAEKYAINLLENNTFIKNKYGAKIYCYLAYI
jgi:hypothetical protein